MNLPRSSLESYRMLPVVLVTLLVFFSFSLQRPFVPLFAEKELNASIIEIGYITSAIGLTGALSAVPAGFISDRVGRRIPVAVGASIWAASLYLIAVSERPYHVLVAYGLAGVATSILDSSLSASVGDLSRTDRLGRSYGTYFTAVQMSFAAGPISWGLLTLQLGYRSTFITAGILAASAAGVALTFLNRGGHAFTPDSSPQPSRSKLKAGGPIWMGWLAIFSASTLLAGVGAVLPIYAASEGFDELLIGLIFTIQAAASMSARFPFGHLIDRKPRTARTILISILVASTATASVTIYPQYIWLVAMMAISGIGISVTVMSASVAIARHTDTGNRGLAMGFASMSRFSGFMVGPALAASITSMLSDTYTGYLFGFVGLAVVALLSVICGLYFGWRAERGDSTSNGNK